MKKSRSFMVFLSVLTLAISLALPLSGCAKSETPDVSEAAEYHLSTQSFTVETEHLTYGDQDAAPDMDLAVSEIQYLQLEEAGRMDFAKLDEVLNKHKDELMQYGLARTEEFGQSALEWEDYKREDFYPYSSNWTVELIRADDHVLSFLEECNEYCGGVHPTSFYEGINLDPQTGTSISLDQVVADIPALKALVIDKLLAEYAEDEFYADLDTLLADYFAYDETAEVYRPSWTLGEDSLTVWFSPYEIAPYAAGLLQAEIRFDEAPEIFTGEWQ